MDVVLQKVVDHATDLLDARYGALSVPSVELIRRNVQPELMQSWPGDLATRNTSGPTMVVDLS